MVEDTLCEAAYEIAVGAAPVFPLSVDFDQDHVICCDQALRTTAEGFVFGPVKFEPLISHDGKHPLYPGMIVFMLFVDKRIVGDVIDMEDVAGGTLFCLDGID